MVSDALILVQKRKPRSRPRGHFSQPVRAAYRLLGVKPGATLDQIKTTFRGLAHKLHPDHTNTDISDDLRAVKDAYDFICEAYAEAHRKPGRPAKKLKYSGFAIVDVANNEVVADRYLSRKAAEADIPALVEKDKSLPKCDPESQPPKDGLLLKKVPQYIAVGSPDAERKKKQRALQRAARKRFEEPKKPKRSEENDPEAWQDYREALKQLQHEWNSLLASGLTDANGSKIHLSVNHGRYIEQATTGKGLLITGGWNTRLLDLADAAHQTSENVSGYVTRKIRGQRAPARMDYFADPKNRANDKHLEEGDDCWGGLRGPGNGPDQFDADDVTADSTDCEAYSQLSAGDIETERFFGDETDDTRLLPVTEGWDDPASDFESRLTATELDALDEANAPMEMLPEKLDRCVPSGEFSEFPEKEIEDAAQSPFLLDDPATADERREEEQDESPALPAEATPEVLPAAPMPALAEKPKRHAKEYQFSGKLLKK